MRSRYADGGYSGGSTDRPALQRLLADVKAGKIDVIVVYKVDRLTRSLCVPAPVEPSGRRLAESRVGAPRPRRSPGRRTRVGSIQSAFRRSRSAKASLGRSACHGCPWYAIGE
jgi:Resolvase, N terminal domain